MWVSRSAGTSVALYPVHSAKYPTTRLPPGGAARAFSVSIMHISNAAAHASINGITQVGDGILMAIQTSSVASDADVPISLRPKICEGIAETAAGLTAAAAEAAGMVPPKLLARKLKSIVSVALSKLKSPCAKVVADAPKFAASKL